MPPPNEKIFTLIHTLAVVQFALILTAVLV
jgi:hypothetical protein